MRRRRTAVLGFGHVAEHGHLPAWLDRRDFALVAVAEPNAARRARAAELLPEATVYADAAELFAAERIEVVDIAAPPVHHAALALAAAEAGCHILCEKPLATTPADFTAMHSAARRAGVVLYPVHNWKHAPQFTALRALRDEGSLGALQTIRLETIRAGRAVSVGSEWRGDAAIAGGGILVDHGWHALYLLCALANERPRRLRATVERRADAQAAVEDTATCEIEFPSLRGEIFLTWAGDGRATRWTVTGTAATATLADAHGTLEREGEPRALQFARSLSEGSHHPDWFGAVLDGFAAALDEPAHATAALAEAEACVRLTALAYQSSARGGVWLPVPEPLSEAA